jgi:two-component system sensor histidine kinase KdpD
VPRSEGERREILETIDGESDRLNALIADLLDMSRIEAGVLTARVESVDLNEAVTRAVENLGARWPSVDVRVIRGPPPWCGRIGFLGRVFFNLLDNAARAATKAERPGVEVEARVSDGRSVVRVIDHGGGIGPAAREQLFYPFYELRERERRLGPGLGLAIAKGFLALMDGEIWVEETPGSGATFAFSLPRSWTT